MTDPTASSTETPASTPSQGPRAATEPVGVLGGEARGGLLGRLTSWQVYLLKAGIAFVFSRLCVIAGAGLYATQQVVEANVEGKPRPSNALSLIVEALTSWDGRWYFEIVRSGYPRHIPENVTYFVPEARAAFFPLYPKLVRWFDMLLPGGDVTAGIVLNLVFAAVFVYLVGVLVRGQYGDRIAYRSMVLVALFPGSFVLSLTYSEATLLMLAAACLIALDRRQWEVAGIIAALATATRPNGIALVAACAVASFIAIRNDRAWRSIIAPLLSPIGFVAFQLWLRGHAGEATPWLRVQREAWREGTSFGGAAVKGTFDAFLHPLSSPTDMITAVSFITTIALIWMVWRKRLPAPWMAYSAVVLALMLMPSTVTARPRFLFTAFPLLVSAARWLPDEHDERWTLVLAGCAAGLVSVTGIYVFYGAIP